MVSLRRTHSTSSATLFSGHKAVPFNTEWTGSVPGIRPWRDAS